MTNLKTDESKTYQFQHIERVLSNSSSNQIALIGWFLGFESAGLVGLYSIVTNANKELNQLNSQIALGMIMVVVTYLFYRVWRREHQLARQYLELLAAFVVLPKQNSESGITAIVWKTIFVFCFIFWVLEAVCPNLIIIFLIR